MTTGPKDVSNTSSSTAPKRDPVVRNIATIVFAGMIAVIGAGMMTLTSSPFMRGAAMLWIPAALQLMAGVWLGKTRGLIAAGLGAYAAGIFAYGGFGLPDIIMNAVAGGLANGWLPAVLFQTLRIDSSFGIDQHDQGKLLFASLAMLGMVILAGLLPIFSDISPIVSYSAALVLLALSLFMSFLHSPKIWLPLSKAVVVCITSCAVSAVIGTAGTTLTGQSWKAAALGTGVGWFFGDLVSSILGLYMLAIYTPEARRRGIATGN